MHKILILEDEKSNGTKLIVDGKEIQAISYHLAQSVGEVAVLDVEIPCFMVVNKKCEINITGIENVAKLMDEKTFNKFVGMWQKYHSEGPK